MQGEQADAQAEAPALLTIAGGVATITLNRPAAGNAFDFAMAHALSDLLARCRADDQVRCLVITGAGRFFCVGGDVALMGAAGERVSATLLELANTVHEAIAALAAFPKPVLTLVNGPAAGAGFSLALCADLCLAAETASFTPAYAKLGLTPDGGMSWMLPRLMGLRAATELLLTSRRLTAQDALDCRLITRIVAGEALEAEGIRLAQELAAGPIHALSETRKLLLGSFTADLPSHLDAEAASIAATGGHVEGREGIAAFLEKRPARFA